ncbi:MAG: c-type cytochrome [Chthoniobacteraceae bacterium]
MNSRPFVILFGLAVFAHAEPQWIWFARNATNGEQVTLRTEFEVPGEVKSATLQFSIDDSGKALLNDKLALASPAWQQPAKGDVKALLVRGRNTLTLDARNNGSLGAAVAVLAIELVDGKKLAVETGEGWQATHAGKSDTKAAVVIKKYGEGPWGEVFSGKPARGGGPQVAIDPKDIAVPQGFKAELLYTVPKPEQGSWVSMTVDGKGRLITCDQGGGLYRIDVSVSPVKVEPISTPPDIDGRPLGGAHGLLYANGSLYLMNNEKAGKGLWRLRDPGGDEEFASAERLRTIQGGGEHGPHGLALARDGKSIYFASGNHTKLPENMEIARPVAYGEDHLTPRLWDANGHAKGVLAPGGYVARTDLDGKSFELFTIGFRNQYDIAFDANGEIFTYDSDMEWDIGTPWYMPTRINHCVSGGDCGWRSGAGRWPEYYADSLPAAVDIGPGSPTGTIFGTGARFPAKYQRAMFACDWTYGTMWAVHFTPDGASFRAEKEDFLSGKSLPLTDVLIHPKDGAMYFTIGGRNTQSGLYRITYTGGESTAPATPLPLTAEAKLRRDLEKLHDKGTGPEAIEKAWPHLASGDRFIRWAARVAIERQPSSLWAGRALAEMNVESLIALARVGDKSLQPRLIDALSRLDDSLPVLRAWELCFTRMGKPAPDVCAKIAAKLDPIFPHADPLVNRELVQLLVFLDSKKIVGKAVPLLATTRDVVEALASDAVLARNDGYARAAHAMTASRPNRQAIAYAYSLRVATAGWTPALRKTFFAWFPSTRAWKGGNSFTKFLENIRTEALTNVPEPGRAVLDELSKRAAPAPAQNVVMPKGPGRAYGVDDIVALTKGGLKGRSYENGKAMYAATLCASCHHIAGDGGNIGPDLTGVGNRYTMRDLAENIVDPSKVISDQYGSEQIELKDGSVVIGRVVVQENGKLFVMTSPLTPNDLTPVDESAVKSRQPWSVSMMPPGLISSLNEDELKDLLAYLLSGGNAKDKAFAR